MGGNKIAIGVRVSGFGRLARLEFLQNWASRLMAWAPPEVVHNLEKYHAIKKVFYLSSIEDLEGAYLEFGVFTGSSFCHALRCCRSLARRNPRLRKMMFYGFDSFSGFGELSKSDEHPFYKDQNFTSSLAKVEKRVRRAAGGLSFELVPGFFSDSLSGGPASLDVHKAQIIFVDSDTYSSAISAFRFAAPIVDVGTYVVLDDFFSYRGREDRGVAAAFKEFLESNGYSARQVFTYGMGGVVFVISVKP